jgi:hypothetical protein
MLALGLTLLPLRKKEKELAFMVIAFISMWYIHSMVKVFSVPDLDNYEKMFLSTRTMSWRECFEFMGGMETGYVALNKLVSTFTSNYYFFQGLYGFILLFLYFQTFRRYSPYVMVSILLLLVGTYNISIYVMRQFLAVAIFVASFPLILKRKLIPYLLVCVFMFLIHKTAIICMPIYFMYQMKPKILIMSVILLAAGIFFLLDAFMLLSIETVGDYEEYMIKGGSDSQVYVSAAIAGVITLLYVYSVRRLIWEDGVHKLVFILLLLSVLVNLAIVGRPGTLSRLPSFYESATLFALPLIMASKRNILEKSLIFVFIFFIRIYPTYFGSIGLGDLANMKLL